MVSQKNKQPSPKIGAFILARDWAANIVMMSVGVFDKILWKTSLALIEVLEAIIGRDIYIPTSYLYWHGDEQKFSPKMQKMIELFKKLGIIGHLHLGDVRPDEPKMFVMMGDYGDLVDKSDAGEMRTKHISGFSGVDFNDPDKAAIRTLGEALERTCNYSFFKKNIIFGSFAELKDRGAINPKEFVNFSDAQFRNDKFSVCRSDENSKFGWTWGESLISGKKVLVPAQLAYLSYMMAHKNEPMLRTPLSTGAATYTDRNEAIYRGLCEAVERDAWMIFWLNQLPAPRIDFDSVGDEIINSIRREFSKYNLELYSFDFTTDIKIPTYGSMILDRTGAGPAVAISTKTDFDSKKALQGSIEEVFKSWWARRRHLEKEYDHDSIVKNRENIFILEDREFLWTPVKMISHMDFLMQGKKITFKPEGPPATSRERLEKSLEYFKENSSEVIAVDIALEEARRLGFHVYIVIAPRLQPLYLSERFPYFGGERLHEVPGKLGYRWKRKTDDDFIKLMPNPHI